MTGTKIPALWRQGRQSRQFGEATADEHGNVTINIDDFLKRSNRRIILPLVGLILAVLASVVLANGGRIASQDSLNASRIGFANNERNACITDRRSVQAAAAGEIQVFFMRALASSSSASGRAPSIAESFKVHPLRDPLTEFADSAAATERWRTVTASLDPAVLNLPKAKGGCGAPITSVDDLKDATSTTTTVRSNKATTTTVRSPHAP